MLYCFIKAPISRANDNQFRALTFMLVKICEEEGLVSGNMVFPAFRDMKNAYINYDNCFDVKKPISQRGELEKLRIDPLKGIKEIVLIFIEKGSPQFQNASKKLNSAFDVHRNVSNLPFAQESILIAEVIEAWSSEEMQACLSLIGLEKLWNDMVNAQHRFLKHEQYLTEENSKKRILKVEGRNTLMEEFRMCMNFIDCVANKYGDFLCQSIITKFNVVLEEFTKTIRARETRKQNLKNE